MSLAFWHCRRPGAVHRAASSSASAAAAPLSAGPASPAGRAAPAPRRDAGFTLIELLVVVSIIAVLAGLLLPAISLVRESARKARCGSNQHQIAVAMLVYASDNDGLWPVRPTLSSGQPDLPALKIAAPTDALSTTVGSFEFVVAITGKELSTGCFTCPSAPLVHPQLGVNPTLDRSSSDASFWAEAAAGQATSLLLPGYCYDWSVPANLNSMRVVLADRCLGPLGHGTQVMACFGDGHVAPLALLQDASGYAPGADVTASEDGQLHVVLNPAAANPDGALADADNIYDDQGDGGTMTTLATGSATRAWVH